MNCALCNGETIEKTGEHQFKSKVLGTIYVPHITFEECTECKNKIFSLEQSLVLLDYVREKEQKAIEKLPISGWISAAEAASILEMTRQGLNKNKKIKRGFIYSVKLGNSTVYNKKSVLQFKETNNKDGRFELARSWGSIQPIFVRKKRKTKQNTWSNTIESQNFNLFNKHTVSDHNNENSYTNFA